MIQLKLDASLISGPESRERLRSGWDELVATHLKDGAPLPLTITEQHRQVRPLPSLLEGD